MVVESDVLIPIPVIDLFAGPGGLNEGFSQLGEDVGSPVFETIGSFEMESTACHTLRLRGVYRFLVRNGMPLSNYYRFIRGEIDLGTFYELPEIVAAVESTQADVNQIELGVDREESDQLIRDALDSHNLGSVDSIWALIGGPPCQAYSMAGRSRRTNDVDFANDKKHFLYREYLHIIAEFAPPVFVMENVKGLLSSTHSGRQMFDMIRSDLEKPGPGLEYDIHSLTVDLEPERLQPSDYVIRTELYGVPQKRHRVILLGVKRGLFPATKVPGKLVKSPQVTVRDALTSLPRIRSGISPTRADSSGDWMSIRSSARRDYGNDQRASFDPTLALSRGQAFCRAPMEMTNRSTYSDWISDHRLGGAIQHEARFHMPEDLKRYFYAASVAERNGTSPKLREYPDELLPNHKNARSDVRVFEDRFRVQVWDEPATTIVSHIAKDGHYYIHPDPEQMRSLTVREAARLQSFPDNYFFMGNRTQQYHQVGNAVPPLLANQIAQVVADFLRPDKNLRRSDEALQTNQIVVEPSAMTVLKESLAADLVSRRMVNS